MERIRKGFPGQRMTVIPPAILRRCTALPVVQDLYATRIGHFPSADHHYVERPTGTEDAVLIYCTDGAGWCEIGGEKWLAKAGSALVIPPKTAHSYGARVDAPWSIYWAHLGGSRLYQYLELLEVSSTTPLLYVPDVESLVKGFEEGLTHVRSGYTNESLAGLSTSLIYVLGLMRCRRRAPDARDRRREDRIMHVIDFMHQHLDETLTLDELSGEAKMSSSHFSHRFKQQLGTSPVKFFIRLKMQRACELLDLTDSTVQQIAGQVGYHDPFHFSHMFKKVIGMSPSDYREIIKG